MQARRIRKVVIVGYGEVGRAFERRLEDRAVQVVRVDPQCANLEAGREILPTFPDDLADIDMILAAVPSAASLAVAQEAAKRDGSFVFLELSSSPQTLMCECAALFDNRRARFADAAIMGSVDLAGANAPIVISGPDASEVATMLTCLGFVASALPGSKAGDASGLKLLRSILMKGIEALAVECFVTARRMGLDAELRDGLQDITRSPFPDLLEAMVRTHPIHAARRRQEVEAALDQAHAFGLNLPLTCAVIEAYQQTERKVAFGRPPASAKIGEIVSWLSTSLEAGQ